MSTRGQAAAEYLILLAVVLVVVLIGVVLLGGIFNTGNAAAESESKSYWGGPIRPFGVMEWTQINDTLYLRVVNRFTEQLIMRKVIVGNVTANLGAGWSWRPGGDKSVSIPGLPPCVVGQYDSFIYNLTFEYDSFDLPSQREIGAKPIAGSCSFT